MNELQNKTVTMELNNLQLETIKCLFGHSDWEMNIIEQSAVVEENGGNSHVQINNDQSTQTNNDNVANDADEDNNPEFVIPRIGKPMANKCYDTFWHYVPLVPVKALCSVVSCQSICLH
jgi:hypothetical protein